MPPTKITVRNDGPLRVEGEIELVDMEGKPYGLGGRRPSRFAVAATPRANPFAMGLTRPQASRTSSKP